jgi:phosphate transport system substrate-binding protein
MRRIVSMFLVTISALCVSSCGPKPLVLSSPKPLVIPGTGDSQDILRALEAAYEKSHPNTDIVIPDSTGSFATKEGTLGGLESAGTRTTELGRTAVRPREIDLKKFGPMYYREFARVPVAFVVHKSVPLTELTGQDLCAIYAGHISNWKQLGGPDLPLVVQTRPEGSNMLAIRKAIACFQDLQVTENGHFNQRNSDAVASMHDMEGSIGFMPLSEAQHHGFTVLKLEGKEPLADDYPVTISLGLVHMDPLQGLAKDFTDFLVTDEAASILRRSGHIPVKAESELVGLPKKARDEHSPKTSEKWDRLGSTVR